MRKAIQRYQFVRSFSLLLHRSLTYNAMYFALQIDLAQLRAMTEKRLRTIGVGKNIHRRKLLRLVEEINACRAGQTAEHARDKLKIQGIFLAAALVSAVGAISLGYGLARKQKVTHFDMPSQNLPLGDLKIEKDTNICIGWRNLASWPILIISTRK